MTTSNVLANVSSVAIWGSLGSSVFLGVFLFVQAFVERRQTARYLGLSFVCFATALLDSLHGLLTPLMYEWLRIFFWSLYGGAVDFLLHGSPKRALGLAGAAAMAGVCVWYAADPAFATSAVLPLSFGAAARAHLSDFRARRGYASAVLAGCTACVALSCVLYIPVVSLAAPLLTALGYLHYALLSVSAVVFGWIQLPRELRGSQPVRIDARHGMIFFAVMLIGEAGALPSLVIAGEGGVNAFIAFNLLQLIGISGLYFLHRHLLVIHTDNITQLLEERTASLRTAQRDLALQNERQAELLAEQKRELLDKGAVIERQRRLELAAQTAGQAAHDIQNLVSPMVVQIDRLIRSPESRAADVRRVGEQLRRQIDELLELNSQMLALSRRGRAELVPVDLGELARDAANRFPEHAGRITVRVDGPVWTAGSYSQLSRAVSNLLSNALDASTGPVIVSVERAKVLSSKRCHLGFLESGEHASISIADRGSGISPEIIDRIFEPFFSSKPISNRSGSGLGLSIVAGVVEDHKGTLDLFTGAEGTTVTLYLPLGTAPADAAIDQEMRGTETIALVDDDHALVRQYEEILSAAGYSVLTAADGRDAIALLQLSAVDLMVLDLLMPRKGGIDTMFASLHVRPGVRTIIHSSFVGERELREVQALGARAVLQKPASRRELLSTVRSVLDGG